MLSPEYLLRISEGAEDIAEQLHNDIIRRIVKRIMIRLGRGDNYILTANDKWQLEVLQDAGYLLTDIQAEVAKYTALQQIEILEAMEAAGVENLIYDDAIYTAAGLSPPPLKQSPALLRIAQRNYKSTLGEWKNYTQTTAKAAQQLFIQQCDRAYTLVTSGTISYTQAVKEAADVISTQGVEVVYPTGHKDTIETATLRAVRTGVSQMAAEITDSRMDEMNWDIILVSAHLGARVTDKEDYTNHYWWQGKFYSKSGKDLRFPPFSVCNMGDVQGIHGANCRHSHGPGDGVHNPFEHYGSEKNKEAYDLQQRQRTLERRIRKTKRRVMGLKESVDSAPDEPTRQTQQEAYEKAAALLQKQNQTYNQFCKDNDLKRLTDRISIAKWDRKQAAQAAAAVRRHNSKT